MRMRLGERLSWTRFGWTSWLLIGVPFLFVLALWFLGVLG